MGRGRRARRAAAGRPRGACVRALALGAVGYAMQAGLYFLALARMDASVLSLILYSYPALVTGAAIILRRESASRRRLVALVTASGGLVLVLAGAGVGSLDLAGCALGAGAALTYTTYILVSEGVTPHLDPLPLAALVSTGAAVSLGARRRGDRQPGLRVRHGGLAVARAGGAGLDGRRGRPVLLRPEPGRARRRRRSSRRSSRP